MRGLAKEESETELISGRGGAIRNLVGSVSAGASPVEAWLQSHLELVALSLVALGFLIRAVVASRSWLNPDEALHYLLVNQPSLRRAYQAGLTSAHPPLFFLVLYFWRFLGTSEWMLRLPSVLAGTAFLWMAFQWMREVFGRGAGLIGLLLLTFSPTMILLAAQVRQYALLFLFLASALYFLERAFAEKARGEMLLFSLFLGLAILTHYSALWFTLAVGVYGLVRVVRGRLPGKVVGLWVGSQAGALALYGFLYQTHISNLKGTVLEAMEKGNMRDFYFRPGKDHLLAFMLRQTVDAFQYIFFQDALGIVMLLLFLVSVALLLARGVLPGESKPASYCHGILLLLPFAIGCGVAILGIYPYGGSRRSVFLAPFAMAGVSFALAKLGWRKLWPGLLAAIVVLGISDLGNGSSEFMRSKNQSKELMSRALNDIRQSISSGELVFVDYQTALILAYYLSRDQVFSFQDPGKKFLEFPCGGYRIVSTRYPPLWMFTAENFVAELDEMTRLYGLNPGKQLWVIRAGWNERNARMDLHTELAMRFPELNRLPHQNFGENISVFQVMAGLAGSVSVRAGAT